jgi:hypothetical protein
MAVRRRVLKYKPERTDSRELVKRLLEEKPKINPERERFFAELIDKIEAGRLSEAERRHFIDEFAALRKEVEEEEQRPKKRFRGGTNLKENISNKIRKYKEELKVLKKNK